MYIYKCIYVYIIYIYDHREEGLAQQSRDARRTHPLPSQDIHIYVYIKVCTYVYIYIYI